MSLASVASISLVSGPSQIDRMDRSQNVTLTVELAGRSIGEVQREAMQLSSMRQLSSGVWQIETGELQRTSELFTSFGLPWPLGCFASTRVGTAVP